MDITKYFHLKGKENIVHQNQNSPYCEMCEYESIHFIKQPNEDQWYTKSIR